MVKHYLYFLIVIVVISVTNASRRKGELNNEAWNGKWFPFDPQHPPTNEQLTTKQQEHNNCDDGVNNIDIDFAPNDKRHNYNYLCITNNYTAYLPNLQTQPLLNEYYIPPAYQPHSECLNAPINYAYDIPTYGPFRPLPPKYGAYKYLPKQRWLRSLAEGAIVMLYHPCADNSQRLELEKYVKSCLYRHIISASAALSSERPFALLVWGKLLQMSVVERHLVIDFIKNNAKKGPLYDEESQAKKLYDSMLINEAHLITDLKDTEVCGFNSIEM